jgi:hypothetical protein
MDKVVRLAIPLLLKDISFKNGFFVMFSTFSSFNLLLLSICTADLSLIKINSSNHPLLYRQFFYE